MTTMMEQMLDRLEPKTHELDESDRILVRGLIARLHAGEVVRVSDDQRSRLAALVTRHCIIPEVNRG